MIVARLCLAFTSGGTSPFRLNAVAELLSVPKTRAGEAGASVPRQTSDQEIGCGFGSSAQFGQQPAVRSLIGARGELDVRGAILTIPRLRAEGM